MVIYPNGLKRESALTVLAVAQSSQATRRTTDLSARALGALRSRFKWVLGFAAFDFRPQTLPQIPQITSVHAGNLSHLCVWSLGAQTRR